MDNSDNQEFEQLYFDLFGEFPRSETHGQSDFNFPEIVQQSIGAEVDQLIGTLQNEDLINFWSQQTKIKPREKIMSYINPRENLFLRK